MTQVPMVHSLSRLRRPRRGIAAMWALVVLAVLGLLLATTTTQMLAGRRSLDFRHNRLQARCLARAGVELAIARLLADPTDLQGETVELIPGSEVRIEVQGDKEKKDTFVISSEARYPTTAKEGVVVTSVQRVVRRLAEKDRVRIEIVR